jgi:NitT/TauT family transport system ATP-binding protein
MVMGTSLKIGYMLQKDHLFDWRTIYQNVMLGLEIRRIVTPEAKGRALKLLRTYGLYEFKDKYPNQLSGGMRQRVALIRTLMTDPQINRTPLSSRETPEFRYYFQEIWKGLDVHGP